MGTNCAVVTGVLVAVAAVVVVTVTLTVTLLANGGSSSDRNDSAKQETVYWSQPPGEGATRYSPLDDLDKYNVNRLKLAWQYTYPAPKNIDFSWQYMYEGGAPIMVDNGAGRKVLIGVTPYHMVFALDAATGEELWQNSDAILKEETWRSIPAFADASLAPASLRGVNTWLDPLKNVGESCRRIVYVISLDYSIPLTLVAMDAANGRRCRNFGTDGFLNIQPPDETGRCPDCMTSFKNYVTIIGDVLTVTPSIADGVSIRAPKGDIPGYHTRTGKKLWTFYVIPRNQSDPAMATWLNSTANIGGCNSWIPVGGDEELGMFYVATSSPSGDEMGTSRHGNNLYCDCVIAINASSGQLVWYRQLVHHNIWDYDMNATPVISEMTIKGQTRKVVIQTTKMGFMFVFNARTGEPLYDIEERPVPQTQVPGEYTSPTQPFPRDDFLVVSHHSLDLEAGKDLWTDGGEGEGEQACINTGIDPIAQIFKPPALGRGTYVIPGANGGFNVGGASVHPGRSIAVAVINEMIGAIQLMPANSTDEQPDWCTIYRKYPDSPYWACITFSVVREDQVPCFAPPWAKMVAFDLNQGRVLWQVPYGKVIPEYDTGQTHVTGGLLVTASGLIIADNQHDGIMRIFDIQNGHELWRSAEVSEQYQQGNPITYRVDGLQFVVRQNRALQKGVGGYVQAYAME